MNLRRNFSLLLLSAYLSSPGYAGAPTAVPRIEYRDNPRPIHLRIPLVPEAMRRIQISLSQPKGAELRAEIGPQGPASLRAPAKNPTLRARGEGKPLPMTAYVGLAMGRFGRTEDQRLALYWAREDHFGTAYWPSGFQDRNPLFLAASQLEATLGSTSPSAWLDYARSLPEGSLVSFQPRSLAAMIFLYGGPEAPAKRELDQQLTQIVAMGSGWKPLRGTHSPAFLGDTGAPFRAVMVAGPLLLCASGEQAEETLGQLSAWIDRPLPEAPKAPKNPMPRPPERSGSEGSSR